MAVASKANTQSVNSSRPIWVMLGTSARTAASVAASPVTVEPAARSTTSDRPRAARPATTAAGR